MGARLQAVEEVTATGISPNPGIGVWGDTLYCITPEKLSRSRRFSSLVCLQAGVCITSVTGGEKCHSGGILFKSSTVLSRNKMLHDMGGCPPITEGLRRRVKNKKVPLWLKWEPFQIASGLAGKDFSGEILNDQKKKETKIPVT
jgi:hypothetical protein